MTLYVHKTTNITGIFNNSTEPSLSRKVTTAWVVKKLPSFACNTKIQCSHMPITDLSPVPYTCSLYFHTFATHCQKIDPVN
jgi:hypothetical protein